MALTVNDLKRGDMVFVEDNLGQLHLEKVRSVSKYHIYIGCQRFYKKTGWELQFIQSPMTKGLQPFRDRIHFGDGVLFTQEDADKRTLRQREQVRREEVIYHLTHLTSSQFRTLSTDTLLQIYELTTEAQNDTRTHPT